ncbi:MAG: transcription-repair coupling factor [Firmicutes bacterium]|jgi:transcription-repair coupling factor (superfamily II helicase)|uniref:Transcription-repair-coupling factor n=1 Tax=Sulfobacillus benefaciens TaxID=453960 RepID=A0A2T2X8R3_9FIRM|nr:transcription-repair coupling factor [Bacillota bacterium]MCL5014275.1 transcription-repair coupling factor [Bacillota bacterium]PSR30875.1 MAG: transcription-repair coupling factor [Sulfobacillus benefaciens]
MADLSSLISLWSNLAPYRNLVEMLKQGKTTQVFGLSGSLPSFLTAAAAQDLPGPCLVVTVGFQEARAFEAELSQFLPDAPIYLLPPRPHIVGEVQAHSHDWSLMRLEALTQAAHNPRAILIASVESCRQLVPPMSAEPLTVQVGQQTSLEDVVQHLTDLGYRREGEATEQGVYAVRGGLVDVFVPGGPAYRMEWFDDEIDSLRVFDVESQKTVEMVPNTRIGPASEMLITTEQRQRGMDRIAREADLLIRNLESMGQFDTAQKARERVGRWLGDLADGRLFAGVERFGQAFQNLKPITQVFSRKPLVVFHDLPRIGEALLGRDADDREERLRRLERGDFLPVEAETVLDHDQFFSRIKGYGELSLSLMPHNRRESELHLNLTGRPAPRMHGQAELLKAEILRLRKSRMRVGLVLRDDEALRVMQSQLLDMGIACREGLGERGEVGLLTGHLGHGFILSELSLALLGETELSGREPKNTPKRSGREKKQTVRLGDLRPGDYVVHITHGIGRYLGIKTLTIQDQHKDYLHVQYAGQDTLYVPTDQLGLIQKYIGVEGQEPKLSKMGGQEWSRVKDKVRASVREMAEELIRLYAIRESRPGFGFVPDTPWQREFEAAFGYDETEDQLRSIDDIKRDMEKPRPMDRLLCGDVGYGKTEVAFRSAFKAIMSGKQVAFLVPTTLLADQHYTTAKARFSGFPVVVDVLSRFRTGKQQRDIIERLGKGQIDLIIGTHRLLGKDVKFSDLGLLIVDEEHRFGVAHKERIKEIRANIDVLTLSATPIPRTLHMAMAGVRDMSLIETPPLDRLPVETVVAEFDEDLVREAIRRELDRGGQVFYVQNRILAIDQTVSRLMKMFPDAAIGVVHGRMDETRIEDVMARFVEQEYDILVATSIIESGLDIPNANTLIVEDADKLGLAQLYQLRGRVGRSARLAYAYFTYKRDKVLSPPAEKRLEAIREFTELGAGYQIALRDLEIRGAGNLLGAEQHGFIASVGFDLYTQLLAEAVRELKGEAVPTVIEPQIDIAVDAYLPDLFINVPSVKVELYKRLVSCKNLDEIEELAEEIEDRFGPMPSPVTRLLQLSRVRVMAKELKIGQLSHKNDRIVITTLPQTPMGADVIRILAHHYPGRLIPSPGKAPELGVKLPVRHTTEQALDVAEDILLMMKEALSGMKQESG